jgi:ubiquinone/menaquinone biosynthesis C-methylase UbiE
MIMTSDAYREIASYYDNLYHTKTNVWEEVAGRGPEFLRYVAALVESHNPARYLDVGCGEGFLLGTTSVPQRFGIEISWEALKTARTHAEAHFTRGCAEELPYPNECFDVVTAIGVIAHVVDYVSALREIHRVLRTDGLSILSFYMKVPVKERIMIKTAEFVFPRFRPVRLALWTGKKLHEMRNRPQGTGRSRNRVEQPINSKFPERYLRKLFKTSGFEVLREITKRKSPDAPLPGHHFRIYVLRKRVRTPQQ